MSNTDPETPETFPDVSQSARTAIVLTAVLSAIYGALFLFLAGDRTEGLIGLGASLVLGATLITLSYIDLRTGLLPDLLTLPLAAAGVVHAIFYPPGLVLSGLGLVVGYGLIAGLAYYWRKVRGYEGIGLGDAKLLAVGGAWLGVQLLPLVLLVASSFGILAILTVSQKTRDQTYPQALAFGPCLALGIWIIWCLNNMISF